MDNQADFAFRKEALAALNQEKKMFKKLELHNYIEDMRKSANSQIHDFFKGVDPNTAPKNIKLMYYYFVGSRNLYNEMTAEAIQDFRKNSEIAKITKNERKSIY